MTISEHLSTFAGFVVTDYDPKVGIAQPKCAYRIMAGWEAKVPFDALLEGFLRDPRAAEVPALLIGTWGEVLDDGMDDTVATLVRSSDRLRPLGAIFLGEVVMEESEISWITQADVTPILKAFPRLEILRVRGGQGVALEPTTHASLRELAFEAGGLPGEIARAVAASSFPSLEHLELWLGTDQYGGTTKLADLEGLLRKDPFPTLRYLGLRNSEIVGEIVWALSGSPVLSHLRELDLSMGTLTDEEATRLLQIPELRKIETLDLSESYLTPPVIRLLEAGSLRIVADGQRKADEYRGKSYRYVSVSE